MADEGEVCGSVSGSVSWECGFELGESGGFRSDFAIGDHKQQDTESTKSFI